MHPCTHAPLSPEMRPDGQCGQRRNMNQSPWRRAAHASATCAPLTPEMCPDRRYGQTWNNQSPRRRAAHVSATVQPGPISEEADEPDTLIIGDSTIKDITVDSVESCRFLGTIITQDLKWELNIRSSRAKRYSNMMMLETGSLFLILYGLCQIPLAQRQTPRKDETMETTQTWKSQESGAGLAEWQRVGTNLVMES
ncbi:unnamed protein product [Gadus morhua 'NCC']